MHRSISCLPARPPVKNNNINAGVCLCTKPLCSPPPRKQDPMAKDPPTTMRVVVVSSLKGTHPVGFMAKVPRPISVIVIVNSKSKCVEYPATPCRLPRCLYEVPLEFVTSLLSQPILLPKNLLPQSSSRPSTPFPFPSPSAFASPSPCASSPWPPSSSPRR